MCKQAFPKSSVRLNTLSGSAFRGCNIQIRPLVGLKVLGDLVQGGGFIWGLPQLPLLLRGEPGNISKPQNKIIYQVPQKAEWNDHTTPQFHFHSRWPIKAWYLRSGWQHTPSTYYPTLYRRQGWRPVTWCTQPKAAILGSGSPGHLLRMQLIWHQQQNTSNFTQKWARDFCSHFSNTYVHNMSPMDTWKDIQHH